ncbi:hypothetical protein PsorP6_004152 [Peronosclerospora sorghi]|uniref:Uncharacterized protein n=1 Tax=Peronosclerospora sorghi TaxID=230839 RepID=A0ACC0VLE2_9STRA|nr:hypothetical protein PsorP6_004152 [Peronosclerospora sorghi]
MKIMNVLSVEGIENFSNSVCIFELSNFTDMSQKVIAMAADALDALGIKNKVILEINSLGDNESRAKYRVALESFFSKYKEDLSADSINRLQRGSVLRILDSKNEMDQKLVAAAPQLNEFLSDESKTVEKGYRLNNVLSGLDALEISYVYNTRLVRGLAFLVLTHACYYCASQDYYSDTVFEFVERQQSAVSDEKDEIRGGIAVIAGGCYDGLAKSLGGPTMACVGWAAGVDRLTLLREVPVEVMLSVAVVPVLVGNNVNRVLHEAMHIAQMLRRRGLTVHFCHGRSNMKKQMKTAERYGSTYAVILGDAEINKQVIKIKNLGKRQEIELSMEELSNFEFL